MSPSNLPEHRLHHVLPLAVLALIGVSTATPATAQTTLGGQVRPRAEVRDPLAGGMEAFTSMRTRLDLTARLAPTARAFVQLQDVRFWGEELGTLADFRADGLDLHQGWVEFGTEGASTLWVRAGRQEVSFGGERLVGAVDWTQQGRSFDGIRGAALLGELRLDVFGYQLAEEVGGTAPDDASFLGVHGVLDAGPDRTLDLYLLHDRSETAAARRRSTLGARYAAGTGPWSYRAEASLQRGEIGGDDLDAWMLGARLGRTFDGGRSGAVLWYDLLSGDEEPGDGEIGAFNTLFATNHKFYGFADLFLDIPAATGQRGLSDAAVKTFLDMSPTVRLSADLHHFRVAEDRGLSTARLGEELDLTARWRYTEALTFSGGFSFVAQGDGLAELGRLDENMIWAYLMLDASF